MKQSISVQTYDFFPYYGYGNQKRIYIEIFEKW